MHECHGSGLCRRRTKCAHTGETLQVFLHNRRTFSKSPPPSSPFHETHVGSACQEMRPKQAVRPRQAKDPRLTRGGSPPGPSLPPKRRRTRRSGTSRRRHPTLQLRLLQLRPRQCQPPLPLQRRHQPRHLPPTAGATVRRTAAAAAQLTSRCAPRATGANAPRYVLCRVERSTASMPKPATHTHTASYRFVPCVVRSLMARRLALGTR